MHSKITYPSITSLKQFLAGGVASSQAWETGAEGPGDLSLSESSAVAALRRQSQELPHFSLESSDDVANWHFLGVLWLLLEANEDFNGDDGSLTEEADALTGDVDTLVGDEWSDKVPFSPLPFNMLMYILLHRTTHI